MIIYENNRRRIGMKKTAILLAAALGFSSIAPAMAASYSFSDIAASEYDWCAPHIEKMYKAGYVSGYEDGSYRPQNEVTKLECIALFARAMGSRDEANEILVEYGHEKNDTEIMKCSLSWGSDEIAYMMYKGALSISDLTTYIKGTTKNEPMTREEAAVIITKAMGGEAEAKAANSSAYLGFTDSKDISSSYAPYVSYVSNEGIMNGMEDGSFSPKGTVTRAQIATMLSRMVDACGYEFSTARITGVDTKNETITITIDGDEELYDVTDATNLYILGEYSILEDIPSNISAIVSLSKGELVSVDCMSDSPDQEVSIIFSSFAQTNGVYVLRGKTSENAVPTSYTCIANVPITYNGSPASINSIKQNDRITLNMSNGKVQSISYSEQTVTVTGATVSKLDITDDKVIMTIASGNPEYDGKSYEVSDSVSVTKNSSDTDLSSIYEGDKVDLTIKSDIITRIKATATTTTVTGTLKEVTIATQPRITVTVDGNDKTYTVPTNCSITVNNGEGTVYDFRVGDSLTLTVQSNTVKTIKCSTAVVNVSGTVSGTVQTVNTAYGFISVLIDGSDIPVTVFCKDNTAKIMDTKGTTVKLSSLKGGDTVECHGTTSNGAYVATLVIVTSASK